jgi:hypothetical protein
MEGSQYAQAHARHVLRLLGEQPKAVMRLGIRIIRRPSQGTLAAPQSGATLIRLWRVEGNVIRTSFDRVKRTNAITAMTKKPAARAEERPQSLR